jgi:hypothetical protein
MVYVIQVCWQLASRIMMECTSILILRASCQQTSMTYTNAVCTVKNSWWWTEELSETCRVSFREKIWEISASSWFYYKNLLRCTVTWTLNWNETGTKSIPDNLCSKWPKVIIAYLFGLTVSYHWRMWTPWEVWLRSLEGMRLLGSHSLKWQQNIDLSLGQIETGTLHCMWLGIESSKGFSRNISFGYHNRYGIS